MEEVAPPQWNYGQAPSRVEYGDGWSLLSGMGVRRRVELSMGRGGFSSVEWGSGAEWSGVWGGMAPPQWNEGQAPSGDERPLLSEMGI